MRRLWSSLAVLAALFCAALFNTHCMGSFADELTGLLSQAESCAEQGDWVAAAQKTDEALARWSGKEDYLHMMLQHTDIDEILLDFQEVRQLIDDQEHGGEYSAANARLMTRIWLLKEAEQLSLKNLF